jgi:hypothetical protein
MYPIAGRRVQSDYLVFALIGSTPLGGIYSSRVFDWIRIGSRSRAGWHNLGGTISRAVFEVTDTVCCLWPKRMLRKVTASFSMCE